MRISVAREQIKDVLSEAKTQFISISISNQSGKWSDDYFLIQDIREFKKGGEKITLLLLKSSKDSECTVIDVTLIHGIKFNKYLSLNGHLSDEVQMVSEDSVVQQPYEIFSSSFIS
ncbi:MAG TPA: hypothetical protein VD884_11670 [Ohtaekwangia sp.]|nr:hypothetical protein [Ohtaekwangia sp.]